MCWGCLLDPDGCEKVKGRVLFVEAVLTLTNGRPGCVWAQLEADCHSYSL